MSERDQGDSSEGERQHSVLAELPRARPQRPSRRREAARKAQAGRSDTSRADSDAARPQVKTADAAGAPTDEAASAAAGKARRPARSGARPRRGGAGGGARPSGRQQEPAPRQGFEPEAEIAAGTPVSPPGAVELIESLAELAGELTQQGVATAGRLIRAAFKRS